MQVLKDEVHYKLSSGFFENRLLERGLNGDDECTIDIFETKCFFKMRKYSANLLKFK